MDDFVVRRFLLLHVYGAALCVAPFFIVSTKPKDAS